MLRAMGWSGEGGLGAEEQGIAEPVKPDMQRSKVGVGHSKSGGKGAGRNSEAHQRATPKEFNAAELLPTHDMMLGDNRVGLGASHTADTASPASHVEPVPTTSATDSGGRSGFVLGFPAPGNTHSNLHGGEANGDKLGSIGSTSTVEEVKKVDPTIGKELTPLVVEVPAASEAQVKPCAVSFWIDRG